jgi:hypothetical protein
MNTSVREKLLTIGMHLDRNVFPRVKDGGIVVPSDTPVPFSLGKEIANAEGKRKSRTSSGASFGSSQARGPWAAGQTASFLGADPKTYEEQDIDKLLGNYPMSIGWRRNQGYWLLVESALFDEFDRAAIFLVGLSTENKIVRGWGFWRESAVSCRWIGPRHTNFPDGSICAFVPAEGTWVFGDPIVELVDLYTVWAARHLHFEIFGRWPGAQDSFHPYERLLEFHEDEYCSCGSEARYGQCCRDSDLARNRISDAIAFSLKLETGKREPPREIINAALGLSDPPELDARIGFYGT